MALIDQSLVGKLRALTLRPSSCFIEAALFGKENNGNDEGFLLTALGDPENVNLSPKLRSE